MIKGKKIVLSIDPGFERLGICVLEKDYNLSNKNIKILHSECFKTSKDLVFFDRLLKLGLHIENIIKKYKPDDLAIENLFMTTNQKTAFKVSEVRGAILYISNKNNLNIFEYTPLQIKLSITGSGKSDKNSVQKMLYILIPELKNIDKKIDDEYDAIACGLTHFALEKRL